MTTELAAAGTATLLRSREVVDLIGVSFRTLDHWTRTGMLPCAVPAAGSGSRRAYSTHDVLVARAFARIRFALLGTATPTHGADWWPVLTAAFIAVCSNDQLTSPTGLAIPMAGGAHLWLPDLSLSTAEREVLGV